MVSETLEGPDGHLERQGGSLTANDHFYALYWELYDQYIAEGMSGADADAQASEEAAEEAYGERFDYPWE